MRRYFQATIKENTQLRSNYKLLTVHAPDSTIEPSPGHFYMLEVNKGYDPLLKRAFSIFRKTSQGLQFLYRVQGRGTSLLANMKEGSGIHVLGPLGNPYPIPSSKQIPLVVAGGIGIASVFPLVEVLAKRVHLFYGAQSKEELLMHDELRGLAGEMVICTDDGSAGEKGTVVDSLSHFLGSRNALYERYVMYGCGPKPMLKMLVKEALSKNIKTYVSLEEHMACGVGACLGCVVEGSSKKAAEKRYKKVCTDGPVFRVEEIAWEDQK